MKRGRGSDGRFRWAALVCSLALALVAAPLGGTAQAVPYDPNEVWTTVYDENWNPIEGADVTLYDASKAFFGSATTDANGEAGFTGLTAGDYYVSAAAAGFVEEFYWDSPDLAGAAPLTVDEFTGAVAELDLAAEPQIQGTVTGPGGTPLQDAQVTAYEYDASWDGWLDVDWAYTDPDGTYSFGGLADGSYRLEFTAEGHVGEYFDNQPDIETADDVVVASGTAPLVRDAQLDLAKHITGTVTDGSVPLEGVSVVAEQQVEEFGDVYWDGVSFATTDVDGSYSLDVDPGDYRVRFDSDTHMPEWWDNAHLEADADLVPVVGGDVSAIDATLDEGGSIAGTVTTAVGGTPVPDVTAFAYRKNTGGGDPWEFADSATTATDGSYTIDNLLGGTYRVEFQDWTDTHLTEYYANAERLEDATDIPVTLGNTTNGIDAALDKAPVITGTVSGPAGPINTGNYEVSLLEPDRSSESGWSEAFGFPEITGSTYRFEGLQPGSYRLRVSSPGLAPEFWDATTNAYEVADATDILAARNVTSTADVTLGTGLQISGTVSALAGALVGADVEIQRKSAGPDGRFWDSYGQATTVAGGDYSAAVAPGTYRLRFSAPEHVTEWHDGSATASRSTQLQVTTDTDIDATLNRLGRIGGTVTGPSGGVSGAAVTVWRFQGGYGQEQSTFTQVRAATTGAGGAYSVTGLTPGNYRVGFRAPGLAPEFNLDALDVEHADDVVVELDQSDTVDAALVASTQVLSGTVAGEQAAGGTAPLQGAAVTIERRVVRQDYITYWRTIATTTTGATGAWDVPVVSGDHRVSFSAAGHLDQWYDGAATELGAELVPVPGAGQSGVDAVLARAGTITGTVTDAVTSQPIPDADVFADGVDGQGDAFTSTDASGDFTLDNLAPGDWVLSYSEESHVKEYWNDQSTFDAAQRIPVAAGSSIVADAALAPATPVSGTVTGTAGAPLHFARVDLYRELSGDQVAYHDTVFTESDGSWSTFLPSGSYLVEFEHFGDEGYLVEWYDDAATRASATSVPVGAGAVTGVDAQLEVGGVIEGTVTSQGGQPAANAYVSLYPAGATQDWESVWEEFVDEDGHYRAVGLPAGSYRVRFETFDRDLMPEFHQDKADLASADPVSVALGGTTTVDAQLTPYPRTISGTVTDAQGRGLDNAEVALYRKAGSAWLYETDVDTDADGKYGIPVRTGEYRLRFADYDNRLAEWWDDAETAAQATTVLVGLADRAGIDAQLVDGGVVTGTVTYPAHQTGWDSVVTLFDAANGEWVGDAYVSAHQNRFRIDELPTGTYRAEFNRVGGFHTAEAQFWNGRPEHQGAGTQTVQVTAGSTTSGINATLVDGGILTGQVENGQGDPLEGCVVWADTATGTLTSRRSHPTGADGSALVPGLTTGSYRVSVIGGECGTTRLYYDGAGQLTTSAGSAVLVPATPGTPAAIPQALVVPTGGVITNTVLPTVNDTTPEVGQTLTATNGSWSQAGVSVAYQWLSDGTPIAGATGATYLVGASHAGKKISVRVTASKPDYVDGVATSVATAPVATNDPPITNTVLPTISDMTPELGQTLTGTNGTWSETGLTFTRQWMADGVDIPGATSATYQVTAAELGKVLRFRVTAGKTGFASGTATSEPTAAVDEPDITNTVKPTVDDTTPAVGQTLTAGDGTWSQPGVSFTYRWLRDGAAIPGATSKTYVVVTADEGTTLRVEVTASKAGFDSGTAISNATSPVVKPTITDTVAPKVSDPTPELGQQLTADPGAWTQSEGVTFDYQWVRGAADIAGATSASYTTVADDVGQRLRVRVTAGKTGFTSGTAQSAQTEPVVDPSAVVTNLTLPTVSGTPAVGRTLAANAGTWTPADATPAYQWLRDGAPISGAVGSTYTLVAADLGNAISVQVSAARAGWTASVPVTSAATAPVALGTITAPKPKITGKLKVGKTLTAKPGSSVPGAVTVRYQWLRNGQAIRKATKQKYKLTRMDRRKRIQVRVTRTANGYRKLVLTSAKTRAIR